MPKPSPETDLSNSYQVAYTEFIQDMKNNNWAEKVVTLLEKNIPTETKQEAEKRILTECMLLEYIVSHDYAKRNYPVTARLYIKIIEDAKKTSLHQSEFFIEKISSLSTLIMILPILELTSVKPLSTKN